MTSCDCGRCEDCAVRPSIARAKEKARQNEADEPRHVCRWCGEAGHFEGQKCEKVKVKRGGYADRARSGDWLWITAPPRSEWFALVSPEEYARRVSEAKAGRAARGTAQGKGAREVLQALTAPKEDRALVRRGRRLLSG